MFDGMFKDLFKTMLPPGETIESIQVKAVQVVQRIIETQQRQEQRIIDLAQNVDRLIELTENRNLPQEREINNEQHGKSIAIGYADHAGIDINPTPGTGSPSGNDTCD